MAEFEKEQFKFPDEKEQEQIDQQDDTAEQNLSADDTKLEIEIEDDTPEEDRGRVPVSPEAVKKLEVETDDLDKYSKEAKDKLIRMKRVWHDERRAKEQAYQEQQEAIAYAQKLMDENRRMRELIQNGTKEYASTLENAAQLELEVAKRAYKQAYDAGDSDAIIEAQNAMQQANLKLLQAKNFKPPSLQQEQIEVKTQQEQYAPQQNQPVDRRLSSWRERNPWYGQDEEMTAAALGLHEKLRRTGEVVIGSEKYYETLDRTIRKRFPEYFEETEGDVDVDVKPEPARTKPSTVVAPAVRSTSSNKVKLNPRQVSLAKKLGLTPEQYALEQKRLEARNG